MLANTMSFSACINGTHLEVSHHMGQLYINGKQICFPHDICSMALSPDKLFVVCSNIRHDGFHVFRDDCPRHNVVAFDFAGNQVWSIQEVWERSFEKRQGIYFCHVSWYSGKTLTERCPCLQLLPEGKEDGEYLVCEAADGVRFFVDLLTGYIIHSERA